MDAPAARLTLLTICVNTKDYRLLTGHELVKSYAAPILHSPPAYRSFFCSNCGSPAPQKPRTILALPR